MTQALVLLDEAIEAGHEEMAALRSGEVDRAEELFIDRSRLMDEAWEARAAVDGATLRGKLEQLRTLHGAITGEARRLKDRLAEDIGRTKKEQKRFSAYGGVRRGTPVVRNRFLNKTS